MAAMLDRLSFGRAIAGGATVTDADWEAFEAAEVATRFPQGYTVSHASGAWRDAATGRPVHEPTIILDVAHGGSQSEQSLIAQIAAAYKRLFHQDAVLRFTLPATIQFI